MNPDHYGWFLTSQGCLDLEHKPSRPAREEIEEEKEPGSPEE